MKRHINLRIIPYLILCVLTLYSCGKQEAEKNSINKELVDTTVIFDKPEAGGKKFELEYETDRQIYKIDQVDLDDDGIEEVIVLSRGKDEKSRVDNYFNFDLMQIFIHRNEAYERVLSDTIYFGVTADYQMIAGDKTRQILVKTDAGGNDPVVSGGMYIYDTKDGFKLMRYIDAGNPQLTDVNKDGLNEILVTGSYWGIMPHIDIINYTSEIISLKDHQLKKINHESAEYYDAIIKESLNKYFEKKRAINAGESVKGAEYPLYKETVSIMINYTAKGDASGLTKFWEEEKEYLRRQLPEEQFVDIYNYITRAIPVMLNA